MAEQKPLRKSSPTHDLTKLPLKGALGRSLPAKLSPAALANGDAAAAAASPVAEPALLEPVKVKIDQQWSCQIQAPQELTVGQKLSMSCNGASIALQKSALHLVLPKAQPFALKILEVSELTDTHAQFVVTAWMAGEIKLENPLLTDGEHVIGLGAVQLNVKSVITKENNPESKPFSPYAPMTLPWPLFLWLIIGFLLAGFVCGLALLVRRYVLQRRFKKWQAEHASALSPLSQMNKELRMLGRELPSASDALEKEAAVKFVAELSRSLRWYLARELSCSSALNASTAGSSAAILREIQRTHQSLASEVARSLKIALDEIAKAEQQLRETKAVSMKAADAHQLLEMVRTVGDQIALLRAKNVGQREGQK